MFRLGKKQLHLIKAINYLITNEWSTFICYKAKQEKKKENKKKTKKNRKEIISIINISRQKTCLQVQRINNNRISIINNRIKTCIELISKLASKRVGRGKSLENHETNCWKLLKTLVKSLENLKIIIFKSLRVITQSLKNYRKLVKKSFKTKNY